LNLLPLLGAGQELKRPLFWALSREIQTVRLDDWKLTRLKYSTGTEFRLYNLKDDSGEKENRASTQPEKVGELNGLLDIWNQQIIDPAFRQNEMKSDQQIKQRLGLFDRLHHYDSFNAKFAEDK
jgi:hypothetical protein